MKKFYANLFLCAALAAAFSACQTASTERKGVVIESPDNSATKTTGANKEAAKTSDFPPAPVAIMQADIKDLEGKTFKLEDKKGKVVVVNLWATWCGPCRVEMPHLVEMQNKYKDKNFEILGLNVDDEPVEAVKSFSEQMKLNYFIGYADDKLSGDIMKLTRQAGIPVSVLINREGKTAGVFFGANQKVISGMKESVEKAVNE